jgi:hypothetical protein
MFEIVTADPNIFRQTIDNCSLSAESLTALLRARQTCLPAKIFYKIGLAPSVSKSYDIFPSDVICPRVVERVDKKRGGQRHAAYEFTIQMAKQFIAEGRTYKSISGLARALREAIDDHKFQPVEERTIRNWLRENDLTPP